MTYFFTECEAEKCMRLDENARMYRKKPLKVMAVQIKWDDFTVETLEGVIHGKKGDYLVRGIKGEFYPCDKEIFEMSYEEVSE